MHPIPLGGHAMRVVHVLSDTNIGGAGVYVENYLLNKAKDMDVIVALPEGAALVQRLRSAGAHVIECTMHGDLSYSKGDVRILTACLQTFMPEVVHTHGSLSGRMAARRVGGNKTVYTKHTLSEVRKGARSVAAAALDNALTDAAIAVSGASRENLLENGMPQKKVHLIYNGIEGIPLPSAALRREARTNFGVEEGEFALLCVARLMPIKNHILLLETVEALSGELPGLRLLLAGGGPLLELLRQHTAKLGLTKRVIFLGELQDVRPVYAAADLFALLSFSENMPLTLLEAMSVGLPALLTEVGGVREAAVPDVTALFTSPTDLLKTVSQLRVLIGDAQMRVQMGAAARRRFEERFTAQVFAQNIDELYKRLVNNDA